MEGCRPGTRNPPHFCYDIAMMLRFRIRSVTSAFCGGVLFLALSCGRVSGANNTTNPTVTETAPLAGATVAELTSVGMVFSEPVTGVDAADILVNGNPSTEMIQIGPEQFEFRFPVPPPGSVVFRWASNHGIHAE